MPAPPSATLFTTPGGQGDVPNRGVADDGIELAARFVAHGFAGAISAWRRNPAITRAVLEEAASAVAPAWWP